MEVTTENSKNLFDDLNKYFISKLHRNDYEVISISKDNKGWTTYSITVLIDGYFVFCLWLANGSNNFGCSEVKASHMNLQFNDVDKRTLYKEFYNKTK